MSDEAKAAVEIAKTVGKAIDQISVVGSFLSRYVSGPAEQLSGMAEDQLKFMRWERQLRLMSKADELLQS